MANNDLQTLLLVLPGNAGRLRILQRLQGIAKICVLVPSAHLEISGWARQYVGDDSWIQYTGTTTSFEEAWAAVKAWLLEGDKARRIDGVMTYDDFGIELCAFIGESASLPCTPLEEIRALRNKHLFRDRCREAGVPAVRHATLKAEADVAAVLEAEPTWKFPSVLKPIKGAGSWHVRKIESAEELQEVFSCLSLELSNGRFPEEIREAGFTLEEYFTGHEVDVDGWARDGKVEFCLVSDNKPALEPYFLELGGYYPSQLPAEAVSALERLTSQVVDAFPGTHTCFHFEAKIDPATLEVMPIEFNARVGGAECPLSVEAVTGYFLPEVAARISLGLPVPEVERKHAVAVSTNIHIFESGTITDCTDEDVDVSGTKLVTSVLCGTVGRQHKPNNGSQSCLGWLSNGGETVEEAERNLKRALSQVRIVVSDADEATLKTA